METTQSLFHKQWSHLKDPHVRALAWILSAPDLLDELSFIWHHKIKTLHFTLEKQKEIALWLCELEKNPTPLHESIGIHHYLRLGHYAEKLLAFYFNHEGLLYVNSLQLHDEDNRTVGEFDYLLYEPDGLLHIEFASKFYLFHQHASEGKSATVFNYLGPKLNDTLGLKMDKILNQQLLLSRHKNVKEVVSLRIVAAKAIIKGWFFYKQHIGQPSLVEGVSPHHCLGYWWTLHEFEQLAVHHAIALDKLSWLAPAQVEIDEVLDKDMLIEEVKRQFANEAGPILVAIMGKHEDVMQEFCRGFIVPDDWEEKANHQLQINEC